MAKKMKTVKAQDIIDLCLDDHKPLKKLLKILKDTDDEISERKEAFEEFAPLLIAHAKSEEQTLYVALKSDEDLREEGCEGDVEHGLADQMVEEAKRENDEDKWSAKVKVLAELVEHHLKEEESEVFPDYKKHSKPDERKELGQRYLKAKSEIEAMGGTDSPSEKSIEGRAGLQ